MVAETIGQPQAESAIRKALNALCKQKALSKEKIREVWHYYIFMPDSDVEVHR
jgi:hypothetical protein